MLENQLQQFGLKEKEAKVYLALLELGQSRIQNIAKKSGIKRTSVYDILDRLIKLGLVSMMIKGNHRLYSAETPEKIKVFWLNQQKNLEIKVKKLDQILPELKNLFSTSEIPRPKIKFFEGTKEIEKIFDDILNCQNKEYWYITSRKKLKELVGKEYLNEYIKNRIAKKIKVYSLRTEMDILEDQYSQSNQEELREIRYLPKGIDFGSTIAIYDNKIAIVSSKKENYGFIIESDEMAKTMLTLAKVLWESCRAKK